MKSGMIHISSLLVFLVGLSLGSVVTLDAWAMGGHKPSPQNEPAPDLTPQGPSRDLLEGIFTQSTEELRAVEALNAQRQYGSAILAAKRIVDRVSIVHPKANYSEHIVVDGILTDQDLRKKFSQLDNRQKEAIARAVGDFKKGFFLDLLNLWKRAKLAYVTAFYNQMRNQLMAEDVRKLRQDLLDVHTITILIEDKKASDTFILFDSDVANEDQQYFFDRELTQFALSIKELNLTEAAFDQVLTQDMQSRLQDHWDGIRAQNQSPARAAEPIWTTAECMTTVHSVMNYDDALRTCTKYTKEIALIRSSCVENAHFVMNYIDSMDICFDRPDEAARITQCFANAHRAMSYQDALTDCKTHNY